MEGIEFHKFSYGHDLIKTTIQTIEEIVDFPSYSPLERQVGQLQGQEPEDPPETIHTPWGVWLHWRDALHHIDQTYDTEHVIRTGMAAEDILHYYHYVPIIGEHKHIAESYEINFEYDYSHGELIYNTNMEFEEENINNLEINFSGDQEELIDEEKSDSNDEEKSDSNDEENEDLDSSEQEISIIDADSENTIYFKFNKDLIRIFEKLIFDKLFRKDKSTELLKSIT